VTSDRIAVLVPSRDRPEELAGAYDSLLRTSEEADLLCYVDEDQRELYEGVVADPSRLKMMFGPRVGPIAAVNALYNSDTEYAAYLVITDDSRLVTPGWDRTLLGIGKKYDVWAASPTHNLGLNMDYAVVSGEWAKALGWVCYPGCYHWCWPSVIEVLGEATTLFRLKPGICHIEHSHLYPSNQHATSSDNAQLYAFFTHGRYYVAVDRLRKAAG
jgi:hypothetical protein